MLSKYHKGQPLNKAMNRNRGRKMMSAIHCPLLVRTQTQNDRDRRPTISDAD